MATGSTVALAGPKHQTKLEVQLQRYYHATGYYHAIWNVARRTVYSPNQAIRHKWIGAVGYLRYVIRDSQTKIDRIRNPQPTYSSNHWIQRQITVAEIIGHSSGSDPWPNCPDPIWNGAHSWQDTVNCENGGNWYDSPGYYRCGLQFDPGWETKYGRLCP